MEGAVFVITDWSSFYAEGMPTVWLDHPHAEKKRSFFSPAWGGRVGLVCLK